MDHTICCVSITFQFLAWFYSESFSFSLTQSKPHNFSGSTLLIYTGVEVRSGLKSADTSKWDTIIHNSCRHTHCVVIFNQDFIPSAFFLHNCFKFMAYIMYFPVKLSVRLKNSTNLLTSQLSPSLLICVLMKEFSHKSAITQLF